MPIRILPELPRQPLVRLPRRDIAACLMALLSTGTDLFVGSGELIELDLRKVLYIDHFVFCFVYRMDQLVQFQMNGSGIAVLGILDQEDHQECDDRGAGIDDQLPGVGVMENGTGKGPDDDDPDRGNECPPGTEIVELRAANLPNRSERVRMVVVVGACSPGSFVTFIVTLAALTEPSVHWHILLQLADHWLDSLSLPL